MRGFPLARGDEKALTAMPHFLCRLTPPRPSFLADMTDEERALMAAHSRYWRPYVEVGRVAAIGAVADPAGAWGVAIIEAPRESLSEYAPRIEKVQIDPSQIGLLIGKGGETIRGLCEEYDSQIDVNDDGQVLIYSSNGEMADALVERIRQMMKEVEVGDEYLGKVVKTTAFGAFIELSKGTDGLLHISNVSRSRSNRRPPRRRSGDRGQDGGGADRACRCQQRRRPAAAPPRGWPRGWPPCPAPAGRG